MCTNDKSNTPGNTLWRPPQKPREAIHAESSDSKSDSVTESEIEAQKSVDSARPGDSGLGRPKQIPTNESTRKVARSEIGTVRHSDDDALSGELQPETLRIPRLFRGLPVMLFLAVALSLLLLFLYAQGLNIYLQLQDMSLQVQLIGLALVAPLVLILLWAGLRLFWALLRFRPNRQVVILRIQTAGGQAPPQHLRRSRKQLAKYLCGFTKKQDKHLAELKELGQSEEEAKALSSACLRLHDDRPVSDRQWIEEFERDFLTPLDELARRRIGGYAKSVALNTAISPFALLDAGIVLHHGFRLLQDLLQIYRVRTDRIGTMYLLGWIIFNSYLAAEIGEHIDKITDSLVEEIANIVGPGILAKAAGGLSARGAEATANYLFTRRIGRRAIKLLRPLAL